MHLIYSTEVKLTYFQIRPQSSIHAFPAAVLEVIVCNSFLLSGSLSFSFCFTVCTMQPHIFNGALYLNHKAKRNHSKLLTTR